MCREKNSHQSLSVRLFPFAIPLFSCLDLLVIFMEGLLLACMIAMLEKPSLYLLFKLRKLR